MGDELRPAFLVDEDVPQSTCRMLVNAGYTALDVRDIGLRGKSDQEVYTYAQKHDLILITCDLGFANTIHFPPTNSAGIMVVRISDQTPISEFNNEILHTVHQLQEQLQHTLAIVELGRVRLRR